MMGGPKSGNNEMRSRSILTILLVALLAGSACNGLGEQLKSRLNRETRSAADLDAATVAAGLREALEHGSSRAVQELGRDGGFWSHPRLRIPVPENLQRVDAGLRRLGQTRLADDFVHSLNRAAEQATPAARTIFVDAIRRLTVHDAIAVLRGPPDAATQYFRRNTESQLTARFLPIVSRSTQAVGVTSYYKRIVQRAEVLGAADTSRFDIDAYVTRKTLDALFTLVAEEERRIREDPVARTTELLRKVFG
jgi:Protein of unknown function (DUF4197)